MKKFLAVLMTAMLAVCSLFGFTACGGDNGNVLKVGMECAYQPYNWTQFDKSNGAVKIKGRAGQYANGYDVKIAKLIAKELDMKLEIHAYEWDSLIPGVQSGALDFIVAGMSPTAERAKKVDFSNPYYESNLVIVVRKDGALANATSLADVAAIAQNADVKISAQSGTFHDTVINQIANVEHGTPLEDFPTLIVALKANTISGYIAEEPGAIADCQANSEFTYIHLVNNDTGFTITDMSNVTLAIGLKKNSELLAKVNAALATISVQQRQDLMEEAITQAGLLTA